MSNYTKATDFAIKDSLLTGNPLKVITGTAHDNEYNAIAIAIATKLESGGALGTPSSGTLTNCTGLPLSGVVDSTTEALGVGSIELGHASDTTITRTGAGAIAVEGAAVLLSGGALGTPSGGTLTNCTGLPISTGVSGLGTGVATGLANAVTGSGSPVLATSPTLVTPNIGVATGTSLNIGTGTLIAGKALAQIVTTQTGAVATGTTIIPNDDTIPQITEGDQYMTLAITPTNASSTLEIDVTFIGSHSVPAHINVALFQDATANALASVDHYQIADVTPASLTFKHTMTAGTTSLTTFRVRAGGEVAGTMTFNGQTGARRHGGVFASRITIKEYLP